MTDALARLVEALDAKDGLVVHQAAATVDGSDYGGFRLTVVAVDCKERGYRQVARSLLLTATASHPDCAVAHYELGELYRGDGEADLAVKALIEACRLAPQDFRFAALLIRMLHVIGAHPEATERSARAAELPGADRAQLRILSELGLYFADYPIGRARHVVDRVKRSFRWVDTARVAREINAAMDEGRGFSLVRLGDGEGAFARINPHDEARFSHLYAWMRREWATMLFGDGFDPLATGYASMVETLMEVCAGADVAGVPYPTWIEHEYRVASHRGAPCLVNIHRWLLEHRDRAPEPLLCDQIIHVELHRQGYLEPIIRRAERIGLISSNSGLAEMLKQRFDLAEVEMFKIPAEKYSSGLRDAEALAGVHFPFVYWDLIRQLSQPQQGRVFLIAAGTLAKFYAATIKQHGGVALDIGSLVDGWMRIPSRPGYDERLALA